MATKKKAIGKATTKRGKDSQVRGLVRQGDVLLLPIDGVPRSTALTERIAGRIVLAQGDSSAHEHIVVGKGSYLQHYGDARRVGRILVVGEDGAELVIDPSPPSGRRHDPISLAPGVWEVRTQRVRSLEDEAKSRAVAD